MTPLALFGLLMALQTNAGSVYLALGRPRVYAAIGGVMLAVMFALIVPLTRARGAEARLQLPIHRIHQLWRDVCTMMRMLYLRLHTSPLFCRPSAPPQPCSPQSPARRNLRVIW